MRAFRWFRGIILWNLSVAHRCFREIRAVKYKTPRGLRMRGTLISCLCLKKSGRQWRGVKKYASRTFSSPANPRKMMQDFIAIWATPPCYSSLTALLFLSYNYSNRKNVKGRIHCRKKLTGSIKFTPKALWLARHMALLYSFTLRMYSFNPILLSRRWLAKSWVESTRSCFITSLSGSDLDGGE